MSKMKLSPASSTSSEIEALPMPLYQQKLNTPCQRVKRIKLKSQSRNRIRRLKR